MRQVNEAELVWSIKYRLTRLSATMRNDLASRDHDKRQRAIQFIAEYLTVEALGRYEILATFDREAVPDSTFTSAAFGRVEGQQPVQLDEFPVSLPNPWQNVGEP